MAKIFGSAGASPSLSEHPRSVLTKIAGFASPVKTKSFLFRENFLSPPAPFAFPPSTFRRPLAYFSSTFRLLVFYLSFTLAQPKGERVLTRQVRCDDGHFRAFLLHKFASAIILTCAWKKALDVRPTHRHKHRGHRFFLGTVKVNQTAQDVGQAVIDTCKLLWQQ